MCSTFPTNAAAFDKQERNQVALEGNSNSFPTTSFLLSSSNCSSTTNVPTSNSSAHLISNVIQTESHRTRIHHRTDEERRETRLMQYREASRRFDQRKAAHREYLQRRVNELQEELLQQQRDNTNHLAQLEMESLLLERQVESALQAARASSPCQPAITPNSHPWFSASDGFTSPCDTRQPSPDSYHIVVPGTLNVPVNDSSSSTTWNGFVSVAPVHGDAGFGLNRLPAAAGDLSFNPMLMKMVPEPRAPTTGTMPCVSAPPHHQMSTPIPVELCASLQTESDRVYAIVKETISEMDSMLLFQQSPSSNKPPKKMFKWEISTWTKGFQLFSRTRKFFANCNAQQTAQYNFTQSENKLKQVFHEVHENKLVQSFGDHILLVHSNKEVGENHVESYKLEFCIEETTKRNGLGHFVASRSISVCPETGKWMPTDEECAGYHYQDSENRNNNKTGCCITGFGRWMTTSDPEQAARALEDRFPSIYLRWEECYIHPLLPSNTELEDLALERFEMMP